jgi:pyruvate dehydrogenase E2 component (dihydrolipoamide acetyltransferase)
MAATITMPKLGFDMAEGTLVRWLKQVGESVNKGEVLAEIETDKATVEVESTDSGVVRKLLINEGETVPVNTPMAIIGTADEKIEEPVKPRFGKNPEIESHPVALPGASAASQLHTSEVVPAIPTGHLKASPLAKKVAQDLRLELNNIQGSGPGGRIVRRDVESALASQVPPARDQIDQAHFVPVYASQGLSDKKIPISKLRSAVGRRMEAAKTTIPHFYVTHEYNMNTLMDLRAQFNRIVPEAEKLSVNDFIIKAIAQTLRQFPNLNASLDGNSILQHGIINIGVAVSVEGGLLTIVCRDADQKPLRQIAAEVKAMAGRAREGKVKSDDIEGSTFSVSNLGMYDVENFAAIINPPEAAILAVGSARQVPVMEGSAIKPGWRMKATLSVDHRVSDGVEAAKFLVALAGFLEEPLRLLA